MAFPANLQSAHDEALRVRAQSIKEIEGAEELSVHANMIERTAIILDFFGYDGPFKDEDDLAVRVLGFGNCVPIHDSYA